MTCDKNKRNNIEKYSGSFSKQLGGCSIVVNQTINSITNMDALGLYTYLCCRPDGWILNPKHLSKHFDCGKDKIYKCLDILIQKGLLERTESRSKGKYSSYHYQHFLESIFNQNELDLPIPEKPDTAKPDTENPDTYKTKTVLNKENITTTTTKSASSSSKNEIKNLTNNTSMLKILNAKHDHIPDDPRTDDEFLQQAMHHIETGDKKYSKTQRLDGLLKIIKSGTFETPPTYTVKQQTKSNDQWVKYNADYFTVLKNDIALGIKPDDTHVMSFDEWKLSHVQG